MRETSQISSLSLFLSRCPAYIQLLSSSKNGHFWRKLLGRREGINETENEAKKMQQLNISKHIHTHSVLKNNIKKKIDENIFVNFLSILYIRRICHEGMVCECTFSFKKNSYWKLTVTSLISRSSFARWSLAILDHSSMKNHFPALLLLFYLCHR